MFPRRPRVEERLLGVWKSDARRTLGEWTWKKGIRHAAKRRFKSLFGKLEITYTPSRVISNLRHRDWTTSQRYSVLASDDSSVAILTFGEMEVKNARRYDSLCLQWARELCAGPRIQHIHFDGRRYWVSLGKNREFFRKIRANRK